jgi:hypothetical protein
MHETPRKMRSFHHDASPTGWAIRHADDHHDHHQQQQQQGTPVSPTVSRRAVGATMMAVTTIARETGRAGQGALDGESYESIRTNLEHGQPPAAPLCLPA